ncbi:PAPA-1-like conserved region-domain-containing protein [Xylariales sp. PMI_506]|nr:PAPA-1-like conserved region-domain-containing protein [Xylariales sp. PMI_506]
MASRPRRAAAQKATTAITDMADSDSVSNTNIRHNRTMSSRTSSRRSEGKSATTIITRQAPSSPSDSNEHIHITVKLPASKLRQATSSRTGSSGRQSLTSRENFVGGEIIEGKRNRGQKKSYVVDSSDDEEDDDAEAEDDEDAEGDEDDDMADLGDDDAEGEIVVDDSMDMDVDAEGEEDEEIVDEDADGEEDDIAADSTPVAPTIKVSKPGALRSTSNSKTKTPTKASGKSAAQAKDSDDDELSELESEEDEIMDTVKVGGGDEDDEDAEGEEDDEVEPTGPAGEEDEELDSDDEIGSRGETPDLTKMTKRQRARFEEGDEGLLKLSDADSNAEVQAKKHFTAEELSMRRAEMARRRRNLSEKRNEEVKRETIDKLLKKQAPKNNRKSQLGLDTPDGEQRANPIFVRWVSTKDGSKVSVPDEILAGPPGRVFVAGGLRNGKMVEEVS